MSELHSNIPEPTWEIVGRIELLKKLWADGLSCSQIGAELGITKNCIIGKVHRLGLEPRKRKPATVMSRQAKAARQRANSAPQRVRQAKGPQPPLEVEETKPSVEFLGIPLLELKHRQCRFPRGDDPILFCGQPTQNSKSFCAHCYKIVYQDAGLGMNPEQLEYARKHYRKGSHTQGARPIARRLGVSLHVVLCAVDPEYRDRHNINSLKWHHQNYSPRERRRKYRISLAEVRLP